MPIPDPDHMPKPEDIPADEAWFWTDEWQAGEREVDKDIAAGRTGPVYTFEEFMAYLASFDDEAAEQEKHQEP